MPARHPTIRAQGAPAPSECHSGDDPKRCIVMRQAAERDEPGNVSQLVGDEYESVLEDPLPGALAEG